MNIRRILYGMLILLICAISCLIIREYIHKERVKNVNIVIGESEIFSSFEIEAAVKCVKQHFELNKDCKLIDLWYDEDRAAAESIMPKNLDLWYDEDRAVDEDMVDRNVIVLFSNIIMTWNFPDKFGKDIQDEYKSNFRFVLRRDNAYSKWKISDEECGY